MDPARLDGPTQAIVGPDGLVYVGDGYFNGRIAVFSTDGELVRSFGRRGFGRGQFNNPHSVAFLTDGTLLVADRDNARLQRFETDGSLLDIWRDEQLGHPWSVTASGSGDVFVVDGGDQADTARRAGIVALSESGNVRCRFSSLGSASGKLDEAHMVAVAESGDLYVAELRNQRAQRFRRTTEEACGFEVDPVWPPVKIAKRMQPLGIATRADRVYISDQRPKEPIRVLDAATGELLDEIAEGRFTRAHGLSLDRQGTLWVVGVAEHQVVRLELDGTELLQLP